jgi:transposase
VNHVAIDLGSRESQICVRQADGTIVDEGKQPTRKLEALLREWAPSRIIVETSAEAFRIADTALSCGHQVRVVPATLVKTLGVGSRGVKNDQKDARVLSEVSCRIDLPSVHIPSAASRTLKSMCGARDVLVGTRTRVINNVRGWLRTQLWRLRTGATETFADRVRAQAKTSELDLPDHVVRQLRVIELLNVELKEADAEVRRIAKEHPVCRRLMTVPGVGPVTAVRFLAALDRCERFGSAHAVQSYLGLTPGERSSSERERRTGITKAGPSSLRWNLVQAAWSAWRQPDEPMVQWAHQIAERRGKQIAVVALARKIAGILYALWRDGTTYRSTLGAQPPPVR